MATIKKYQENNKNAEYAYKYYLNIGYTPEQSSAIVGNLLRESNLNPTAVGDNGKAFGLAQWHPDRQAKAKELYGENWKDFDKQLAFVDWELNNTEKSAGDKLKKSKSVWEAGKVFTDEYERPKVKFNADDKRQQYVTDVYRKHGKMELTPQDKSMFRQAIFNSQVAPYMNQNQQSTTPLTNFDIKIDNSKFASVPDVPQKEEQTKTQEALNTLKETEFIKEYKSFFEEQQPIVQEEQQVQYMQSTDVQGIFNQVSQFVDSGLAQQGGEKNSLWKNIRANRGSGKKPTKEMLEQEAKIKRNAQQGVVKDNNGYWNPNNWGKQVEISGENITVKGVGQPLVGTADTGEQKLLLPNMDYTFPNATKVIERPLKQNELEFLKAFI